MKITNNYNLPNPVYNAICRDNHKSGDYSASMLYKSPRQVIIAKRHYEEIEKDASEMIWALFGTALHKIIEQGTTENEIAEEYMATSILGKSLTGSCDLLTALEDGYKVSDYKTLSVYSIIYMSSMEDWTKQLNTYAFLFGRYGFDIKALEIVAFMRDWMASIAKFDPNYPQCQVQTIKIPIWSHEEQKKYIEDRIRLFESYDIAHKDDQLPECTQAELWQDDTKYAIMKDGRKSAVKLHDSQESAENHLNSLDKKHSITKRIGKAKRCNYCDSRQFCNQYNKLKERGLV